MVFLNSLPEFLSDLILFLCPPMSLSRWQTPHIILALFLTHHSLSHNISHPLILNLTFYPFVTFIESGTLSTIPLLKPSLIHSKVDYCNSLFLNLPRWQLDRLQLILNSATRAVSKHPSLHPYLTHPQIFTLAQNWSTHPVQSSLSPPTKHTNLKNLCISISTFKLTLLLVHLLLSLFNVRQSTLVSK